MQRGWILAKWSRADGRTKFRAPGARGRIRHDPLERGVGGGGEEHTAIRRRFGATLPLTGIPLYAYVRRFGYGPEDTEDLTQGFFAHLLAKDSLAAVRPGHGRFRCFMLVALKRFLSNQQARAAAGKRCGSTVHIPFDGQEAEERYRLEAGHETAPDTLFDRAWGLSIMEAASQQLEEEYRLEGKGDLVPVPKAFRMRRRYRELIEGAVAQTLSTAADRHRRRVS